jgi:FAD/FMN-containing dehydrogenase
MHTFYKGMPDAVVLPTTSAQVQAVVKTCRREQRADRAARLRHRDSSEGPWPRAAA